MSTILHKDSELKLKVIAFTGMPGCGKSEAVRVAKERNIPVFRMGDLVWDETKKRGLPLTDENVGTLATEERKKHGYDIWAKRTIERVKKTYLDVRNSEKNAKTNNKKETRIILIDGLRGDAEVKAFKDEFGSNFILIAIHSPPKARWGRISKRKRDDDTASEEQFKGRDERELAWGLGSSIAVADYIIVNDDKSIEEFRREVGKVLRKVTTGG